MTPTENIQLVSIGNYNISNREAKEANPGNPKPEPPKLNHPWHKKFNLAREHRQALRKGKE